MRKYGRAAVQWFRNGGFKSPPSPHLARVEAKVGKTTLTLTRNGEPVAVVVLVDLTRGMDGTTATFVDLSHFMEHRRVRR